MAQNKRRRHRLEDLYKPPTIQRTPRKKIAPAEEPPTGYTGGYTGWYGVATATAVAEGPPPMVRPALGEFVPKGANTRRLARTWKRFGGTCQRCGCQTIPEFLANQRGWEVFKPFGVAVTPACVSYALATVQHKQSRARGGTHDPENLTLYCYNCNLDDNVEVLQKKTLPVLYGSNPLPLLENGFHHRGRGRSASICRWEDDGGRVPSDRE